MRVCVREAGGGEVTLMSKLKCLDVAVNQTLLRHPDRDFLFESSGSFVVLIFPSVKKHHFLIPT